MTATSPAVSTATNSDRLVEHHIRRFERMRSERAIFDRDWNDIRDLVRPITLSFNNITGQYTLIRQDTMYDGTAPDALEELSCALHSYLTNPAERWFELQLEGVPSEDLSPDELEWLEHATETIYAQYRSPQSNLNSSLHEGYLDIGSFGTNCLYQAWDMDLRGIVFSAEPMAHCYFLENASGHVDTVYRKKSWTIRQVAQEFGEMLPPKLMEIAKKDWDKYVEVMHCVYPRTDQSAGMTPTTMRFGSLWMCLTTGERLYEGGYEGLPYHVARWTKLAGECYGRGPARKCLPDIKMLNAMEKTIIKAGQKQVDPPLVLTNEGWMLPIKTAPGSLIYKENEDSQITPLETKGNLPWGEEKAEQKREFIRKCFYNDWIRRQKKTREQSATEINDDRDEMLTLFAPILGRLTTELHGPMIARSYSLLNSRGLIANAPESMTGRKLTVGYLSQASRAQLESQANQISRYIQDLVPLAQIYPGIMDAVDPDRLAQVLARVRGTPRGIMRSPDELLEMRDQAKKMQMMQQAAQVAEPASKAIKNVADAQGALQSA